MLSDPLLQTEVPAPLHRRLDRRGIGLITVLAFLTGLLWAGGTVASSAAPAAVGAPTSVAPVPRAAAAVTTEKAATEKARPASAGRAAHIATIPATQSPASAPALSAAALLSGVQAPRSVTDDLVAASETTAVPSTGTTRLTSVSSGRIP